jgi:hypothetical protein
MLMMEGSVRLSVPVRFSYYLSRVGQHGRAKEGEKPGLYLIRDPVGRNKLRNRGRQRSPAQSQRNATLLKLGGPPGPSFPIPLSFHTTLACVAHFQTH